MNRHAAFFKGLKGDDAAHPDSFYDEDQDDHDYHEDDYQAHNQQEYVCFLFVLHYTKKHMVVAIHIVCK